MFLLSTWVFAPNAASRRKAVRVMRLFDEALGSMRFPDRFLSGLLVLSSSIEATRRWASRVFLRRPFVRQPPSFRTEYPRRQTR
jgi:hypothetical protein